MASINLETKIAGVSFYQDAVAQLSVGDYLELKREPENNHDSNAIAVHTEGGKQVGYLPRAVARRLSSRMDRGWEASGSVLEQWGGTADKPTYGVLAEIDADDDALQLERELEAEERAEERMQTLRHERRKSKPRTTFIGSLFRLLGALFLLVLIVGFCTSGN